MKILGDKRFENVESKLDKIESRLEKVEEKINNIDKRLIAVETMMHMKDCCMLKDSRLKEKAE